MGMNINDIDLSSPTSPSRPVAMQLIKAWAFDLKKQGQRYSGGSIGLWGTLARYAADDIGNNADELERSDKELAMPHVHCLGNGCPQPSSSRATYMKVPPLSPCEMPPKSLKI